MSSPVRYQSQFNLAFIAAGGCINWPVRLTTQLQRIAKHYARIIFLWPKDVLRPTVAFQNTLQYRASQFLPAKTSPVEPESEPKAAATPRSSSAASLDPKVELLNINALYSLLENRYSKRVYNSCAYIVFIVTECLWQYPTSPALLRPTSNPTYYEDLMAELEQAPGRSWFSRVIKRWKGLIRFS